MKKSAGICQKTVLKQTAMVLVFVLILCMPTQSHAWSASFLESVKGFVQNMYITEKTDDQLLEGALKGMFSGLDPYSVYLNKEETKVYKESLSGQFSGIGVTLLDEPDKKGILVGTVFPDSPAEKAGIQEGDLLIKADQKSLIGINPEDAVPFIKGKADTKVVLTLVRDGRTHTITVVRGEVVILPVTYRIDGEIGYIRINQFGNGTTSGMTTALSAMQQKNILRIMLDLRDNPGGYVDEAVGVGRQLLPPGEMTTLSFRSKEMTDVHYSTSGINPNYFFAVLVNENTASAAEILAGAIQDAGNGVLVGEKTFGKGVVQSLFMLLTSEAYEKYGEKYQETFVTDLEWAAYYGVQVAESEVMGLAKLTTGKYLTRNGRSINEVGLMPEVVAINREPVKGVDISSVFPLAVSKALAVNAYDAAVKSAEAVLKADGYFQESPDKHFDAATQKALQAFQKKMRLTANGTLDAKTAAKLNERLMALRMSSDPQYNKATSALNLLKR